MRAAALALALLSCAPAHWTHYRLVVMPSVRPERMVVIREAVTQWERAAPDVRFDVVTTYYPPEDNTIWLHEGDDNVDWLGWTNRKEAANSTTVVVTHAGFIPLVLEHELGHAMMLEHQPCGIMEPESTEARTVACCDVKQFCKRWGRVGGKCDCR